MCIFSDFNMLVFFGEIWAYLTTLMRSIILYSYNSVVLLEGLDLWGYYVEDDIMLC